MLVGWVWRIMILYSNHFPSNMKTTCFLQQRLKYFWKVYPILSQIGQSHSVYLSYPDVDKFSAWSTLSSSVWIIGFSGTRFLTKDWNTFYVRLGNIVPNVSISLSLLKLSWSGSIFCLANFIIICMDNRLYRNKVLNKEL